MITIKPQISSVTTGPRQSNFELLRIVAMFFVLVVHADFLSLGKPTADDFIQNPMNAWTRTFIESISIVCVNVFILISGWFGIKASLKGFLTLFFQCFFFSFSIYSILLITGRVSLSYRGLFSALSLLPDSWWFIPAYIGLYILSPILNSFLQEKNIKSIFFTLCAFYIFQTLWGWTGVAPFIQNGFSTISFVGLYILARFIRLLKINNLKWGGVIYIISIILLTLIYWIQQSFLNFNLYLFAYVNPLVVLASIGLLMFFANLKIKRSRFINCIAKSSFAVYLLHTNYFVFDNIFSPIIKNIYFKYSGIICLITMLSILLTIFSISIILDKPRIWLWNRFGILIHKDE